MTSLPEPDVVSDQQRAEGLPAAIVLVGLSMLAPLTVDMFLPSLPTIADQFGASDATMQLSVTLFLVFFACSQLFYGPASDRFGRRPLLMLGLVLFSTGGALAFTADSVEVLLAGRILQGLGGGAGPALAQATVLDIYGRERAGQVLAYMSIALPLAPALAPIAGGVLHDAFGWRSVFITLAVLGVVFLIAYRILVPETNRRAGRAAQGIAGLVADYRTLLSSRTYVAYALVMGLMFSGQLVFISSSSFVLIDELGLEAWMFGLSFGFVAMGIMVGAAISGRLMRLRSPKEVVPMGVTLSVVSAAVMTALIWAGVVNVATVLLPMFVVAIGLGVNRPAAMTGALVPFPQIAGLASAVLGLTQLMTASLFNIAYGSAAAVSSETLAMGVLLATSAGLVAVLVLRPGEQQSEPGRPKQ
jgi:DHA1 family bicyclomycin/chloramphenicol resistance-like MFS transporter